MKQLLKALFAVSLITSMSIQAKKLSELEQLYELDKGFVGIIYDRKEDKVYFKIDNLDQEFIYYASLPAGLGSNDIGLDRGKLSESRLAVFERAGNRVFLKQKSTDFVAITDNRQEKNAIDEAFASSVLWGFPVVDSDQDWVLVDASEFIFQDISGVSRRLEKTKQGTNYQIDLTRSSIYMPRTTSFPDNTEVEATVTFVGKNPGDYLKQVAPEPTAVTLKMHHSFVRLPDSDYHPRKYHPKSGFWSVTHQDYAQPIGQSLTQKFIGRHRLAKKNPKAKVSEAVKPIVYYLDPGIPEPIQSALKDGALWWNQAFEAIGYKNAFQVKVLPSNIDPMDVRYNVIQWVHRASRGWSYGSTVVDPRNGEILKGHVTLGSLRVRQDYLIGQGMMAPFAEADEDKSLEEFSLARLRQLAAHEVGHTLGLNHNFAASQYGYESVMDYPHPIFQVLNNKVVAPNAYGVGIGKWDKAAIAYGYQSFARDKEESWLKQLIDENDVNGLLYITDEDARNPGSPHAYASLWDNGSDAVTELERMVKIRQLALENFGANNLQNGRPWSDLEEILLPVYYFHRYQITAAAKWIGGLTYDYSSKRGNQLALQSPVAGDAQQRALLSLLNTLQPDFLLLSDKISRMILPKAAEYQRTRESNQGMSGVAFDQVALAEASAQHTLGLLFHPHRLARLVEQSASDPATPSIDSIATEIHQRVIEQNYDGIKATLHQSVVHLIYSNYLNLLHDKEVSMQVKMQILGVLLSERDYLKRKLTAIRKTSTYYGFYAYQSKRLEEISIEVREELIKLPKMPPGAPI